MAKLSKPTQSIEQYSVKRILKMINQEDQTVAKNVAKALPAIEQVVHRMIDVLQAGGRVFYVGSGTSGRMGFLDASELPPTYGISPNRVQVIMAGGARAVQRAVEGAEDNVDQAQKDIHKKKVDARDLVIGIAASGTTPYTLAALKAAHTFGAQTVLIAHPIAIKPPVFLDDVIHVPVGKEVVEGSTRMKAGTAQKLILNMISTTAMMKLGKTYQGKMVSLMATNQKLHIRAVKIVEDVCRISNANAVALLKSAHFDVKTAIVMHKTGLTYLKASQLLKSMNHRLLQVME